MAESIPIACPSCHQPGEIVTTGQGVKPSAGFVFDAIKVPVCEVCGEVAGLKRAELERLAV